MQASCRDPAARAKHHRAPDMNAPQQGTEKQDDAARAPGEQPPGRRSGQGSASALRHVISQNQDRQQRAESDGEEPARD
jgi:hypothetical protein